MIELILYILGSVPTYEISKKEDDHILTTIGIVVFWPVVIFCGWVMWAISKGK